MILANVHSAYIRYDYYGRVEYTMWIRNLVITGCNKKIIYIQEKFKIM